MLIPLPNSFGDAATNMAIDAALLETIPTGCAIFRHYGWLEPAATFGYAQKHASVVQQLAPDNETPTPPHAAVIRRLTGGGIVDHRNDWTYALILHRSLPATAEPATQLYRHIHQAIGRTLTALGIANQLAPCPKACQPTDPASRQSHPVSHTPYPISHIPHPLSHIPHPLSHIPHPISQIPHPRSHLPHHASHCFRSPAADDVLRPDGQKIAGAAMKRSRRSLLIQGSIDRGALPDSFNFTAFQQHFSQQIAEALQIKTGQLADIRPLFDSQRIEQEKTRFASRAWNQRR